MTTEDDVIVIERDSLDADYAVNFDKPWLVQFENGAVREFDTEDEACAFQREHRWHNGLNIRTGEPLPNKP